MTPRKLNPRTASPRVAASSLRIAHSNGWSFEPPCRGCGWQSTADAAGLALGHAELALEAGAVVGGEGHLFHRSVHHRSMRRRPNATPRRRSRCATRYPWAGPRRRSRGPARTPGTGRCSCRRSGARDTLATLTGARGRDRRGSLLGTGVVPLPARAPALLAMAAATVQERSGGRLDPGSRDRARRCPGALDRLRATVVALRARVRGRAGSRRAATGPARRCRRARRRSGSRRSARGRCGWRARSPTACCSTGARRSGWRRRAGADRGGRARRRSRSADGHRRRVRARARSRPGRRRRPRSPAAGSTPSYPAYARQFVDDWGSTPARPGAAWPAPVMADAIARSATRDAARREYRAAGARPARSSTRSCSRRGPRAEPRGPRSRRSPRPDPSVRGEGRSPALPSQGPEATSTPRTMVKGNR